MSRTKRRNRPRALRKHLGQAAARPVVPDGQTHVLVSKESKVFRVITRRRYRAQSKQVLYKTLQEGPREAEMPLDPRTQGWLTW